MYKHFSLFAVARSSKSSVPHSFCSCTFIQRRAYRASKYYKAFQLQHCSVRSTHPLQPGWGRDSYQWLVSCTSEQLPSHRACGQSCTLSDPHKSRGDGEKNGIKVTCNTVFLQKIGKKIIIIVMLKPCPIFRGKYSTFQLHVNSIPVYSIYV